MKQVVFDYQLGPGAGSCPSKEAMQNATSAKLGYSPFRKTGALKIVSEIQEEGDALRATLRVRHESSQVEGKREFESKEKDCAELAAAMQLAMALAIDPFYARPKAPVETPAVSVETVAPVEKPPVPVSAPTVPWKWSAAVGPMGAWGAAPGNFIPGLSLEVQARVQAFSFALSGQAYVPSSVGLLENSAQTSLLTLKASPCLHRSVFSGCAVLEAGALRSVAENVSQPQVAVTPHLMAGARAGVEFPLNSFLSISVYADALTRLVKVTLLVSEKPEWESPFFAFATGGYLRFQF